jgi:phosphoglycerate dehydrogenase-like enzyme
MTKVAILPTSNALFERAIESAGATVAQLASDVEGLVWTDYHQPELLEEVLGANPQLRWLQLPFAGVDAFAPVLARDDLTITCAKGSYREPVAEHALALCLALGRALPSRIRATSWGEKFAVSLYESEVLIIGGGGIAEELVKLLQPFGCPVTVIRKHSQTALGAKTLALDSLDEALKTVDFVIVAAALTDETRGLFDLDRFAKMKPTAYFVNIARGAHVVTDDLVKALDSGKIAGAAVDVTDPEPLPDGHALWSQPNCIITPHTADTPAQVTRMLAARIHENTVAFLKKGSWQGIVSQELGY